MPLFHPRWKKAVSQLVAQIIADSNITVVPQSHESFTAGLALFNKRFDTGYSLTDCISMVTMKQLNITEVLTHDKHFQQEGLIILFKDSWIDAIAPFPNILIKTAIAFFTISM